MITAQGRSLDEIAAELNGRHGVTDDEPTHHRHRNIRNAVQHGSHCAVCARELKPDEPVWRERIQTGCNCYGWAKYWLAPRCQQCAEGPEGYYDAKPCMGCGRTVYSPWHKVPSKITVCCDDCRAKAISTRAKRKRTKARGTRECLVCCETFEPTRADAKFCSVACRMKAYRRRVTDDATVLLTPTAEP